MKNLTKLALTTIAILVFVPSASAKHKQWDSFSCELAAKNGYDYIQWGKQDKKDNDKELYNMGKSTMVGIQKNIRRHCREGLSSKVYKDLLVKLGSSIKTNWKNAPADPIVKDENKFYYGDMFDCPDGKVNYSYSLLTDNKFTELGGTFVKSKYLKFKTNGKYKLTNNMVKLYNGSSLYGTIIKTSDGVFINLTANPNKKWKCYLSRDIRE